MFDNLGGQGREIDGIVEKEKENRKTARALNFNSSN